MSNIYIQEPPTQGKVLLETTVGDIEIELWSRECPKACRNFIQLCMENYYNKTKFHRVVKDFIVQGDSFLILHCTVSHFLQSQSLQSALEKLWVF